MISKCVICGKPFRHTNPRAKTCSHECRLEYRKQQTQVCVYCGKEFIGSESQTYCSDECRQKGRAMRRSAPKHRNTMAKLKDIALKAYQQGLSYGEYVAREKV